MGGDITVSSVMGCGTTFRFEIQVAVVDAAEVETPAPMQRVIALAPNQPRYRLLIVDDKWTNRQLLIKLLNPLGFELKEASNGEEAIAIWENWEPHLIWMDMRMPVMDGYEVTKRIKATMKGQATAIIALTASVLEEERTIILAGGCDDFVRKPFREADIFDTMHKHLGVRYIYDEPAHSLPKQPVLSNVLTAAAFANLPPELLTRLREATTRLDIDEINSAIAEIHTYNTTLSEGLTILAVDFKYDDILALIQTASNSVNI